MPPTDLSALLDLAQLELDKRYPGIVLESAVQGWAYLGDFRRGVETYGQLIEPSAKDDRWLGVCYFQLFEDMRAQEAFFRAIDKGEVAARVNLAHALRFLERSDEAEIELSKVDATSLCEYDHVLYLRVRSLHEESNGNLRQAIDYAEGAWSRVRGLPEFPILAPSVLSQLGVLYARIGESRKALDYLDLGEGLTEGLEQDKVRLRRVTVLLSLGKLREAEVELGRFRTLPPALNLEHRSLVAELMWWRGDIARAISEYEQVVELSANELTGVDEFAPRIALATLLTFEGRLSEAGEQLESANILISDKSDILIHKFREVLLNIERSDFAFYEAISELEMLAMEFHHLGTLQEEAVVRLRLAALYAVRQPERLNSELSRITEIGEALNNLRFLRKEWVLLSPVHHLLPAEFTRKLTGPRQLEIRTIGESSLILDGETVVLPIRRAPELLAYAIYNHSFTLAQLLHDLFPTVKRQTARSYFHQFRLQLQEAIPGLRISYDSTECTYSIETFIELKWDVDELLRTLPDGEVLDGAAFLPQATSPWTADIRRNLQGGAFDTAKRGLSKKSVRAAK